MVRIKQKYLKPLETYTIKIQSPHFQCRGHGFDPWPRKIPHASEQPRPCATTTEPVLQLLKAESSRAVLCPETTAMRSPRAATRENV